MKPALHIHLIFHPDSATARELAATLAKDWMGVPALQGLRVPVFFGKEDGTKKPPTIDLDTAEHSIVVLLVDSEMTNRITGEGDAWAPFANDLVASSTADGPHLAIPVALDTSAFEFDDKLSERHFLTVDKHSDDLELEDHELLDQRHARLGFTIAVRALQLLDGAGADDLDDRARAPIKVFVSHAKRDLEKTRQDPVRFVQQALGELPVREWFDAREITEGELFEEKIRSGLETSQATLVFLTDSWATRSWCRWEALVAKELGTPIVVVDALTEGEPRSFPYGGNTRLLRWRPAVVAPEDDAEYKEWLQDSRIEGERVIAAAVREALRRRLDGKRLQAIAKPGDQVLDVAPEAARLGGSEKKGVFFYPDPPIGREERQLLERIWEASHFETPMMRMVDEAFKGEKIAVSVSESPDLAHKGLSDHHELLLTDEIHLYLLLAGLQIVYGGKLEPEKLDDPKNFTLRLFRLARDYSQLAADADLELAPIRNAAPWPLWTLYDSNVGKVFGRVAKLEKIDLPDFGLSPEELGADERGFVPPSGPLQLYAWARALTAMREKVTRDTVARLCIGGILEGYKGRLAGLVEEPLISMRHQKPLYLVGALGGCTELVIDLLEQRERPEMRESVAVEKVKGHEEILKLYEEYGGEPANRDAVAEEIRRYGANGPAAALHNGLDDEENRELFAATDPHRIATLVLTGLKRVLEKS